MTLVFRAGQAPMFPTPQDMMPDPRGLVGIGGDLAPKTLLEAYPKGLFPWEGTPPIPWFSPDPRLILEPSSVKVSKSLTKSMRSVEFRLNTAFRNVMIYCATAPRARSSGTWITRAMIGTYVELHYRGWAHSVEVYRDEVAIGGLYGLAIGRAFFGESMFFLEPNASKMALVHLCRQLQRDGFDFVDCQQDTPHLRSMGAHTVSRTDYLSRLGEATSERIKWNPT
jgi:leucyl/phenylalanyl-tRNA--protein transferase